MNMRIGLGPVFELEWLTGARRWQVYALRSGFVGLLLAGMVIVWVGYAGGRSAVDPSILAAVGQAMFSATAGTQLALALMVAPAATAGAICLDRARGNLTHAMATDLSDAEIVLGKLAARLAPVIAMILGTLPVLAIATLLGGVDPMALAGATAVTLAVATLGCATAMLLSVHGTKVHEILLMNYALWGLWMLLGPMWEGISWTLFGVEAPWLLMHLDPFTAAFDGNDPNPAFGLAGQALYVAILLGISLAMTAFAVLRLRPATLRQESRSNRVGSHRVRRSPLPGPTLDGNPVLWREWHRKRPSRWSRGVWLLYFGLVSLFSLIAIVVRILGSNGGEFAALVNAFAVSVGLLLVCLQAPAALVEERVRGSLDVLMTTPLSTRSIVVAKWWGAFRGVPPIAIWPFLVATTLVLDHQIESWYVPIVLVGLTLSCGAMFTSIGLFLATWTPRLGRAIGVTTALFVALTVGWVMVVMALWPGATSNPRSGEFVIMEVSPFWGPGLLTVAVENDGPDINIPAMGLGGLFWTVAQAVLAYGLLELTLMIFDRKVGRMVEPRPGKEPPEPLRTKPKLEPILVEDLA